MMGCSDCKHYRYWAATYWEPSDAECKNVDNITEEDFEKFFCDGKEWGSSECACGGFELAPLEDY